MAGPVEAVVREITKPAVAGQPQATGRGRPQAVLYRGGSGHQALSETIRILRVLTRRDRAIVATEYEDTEARHWVYFYGVERTAGHTWRVSGGAGGSGHGPVRRQPWANLGGWGWPQFLALAGTVHGQGVHRVRLTDKAGRTAEDLVEGGVVLLLSNGAVEMPCQIELLDASHTVLAVQRWPPDQIR